MIREVDLLSYIPDFIKEYEEMRAVQELIQPEIQRLEDETEVVFNNQFISSSDSKSIKRYEKKCCLSSLCLMIR